MQPDEPAPHSFRSSLYPQPAQSIAPWWHTLVLIAAIVVLSIGGAHQLAGPHAAGLSRLGTYAITAVTELAMLAWIWFGMRLRKIPFRSLIGELEPGGQGIAVDLGFAGVFWIGSLFVLGTLGLAWTLISAAIHHRSLALNGPDPAQEQTIHTLLKLAPATASEIAAWILVCAIAGFAEEIVFRGYFQRQFTAWGRGALWAGVVFSAVVFGFGHGYQGGRQMVLLSIFGALFSLLAIVRRSLRAGMIAHAWQDIFAGLGLALLHANHFI